MKSDEIKKLFPFVFEMTADYINPELERRPDNCTGANTLKAALKNYGYENEEVRWLNSFGVIHNMLDLPTVVQAVDPISEKPIGMMFLREPVKVKFILSSLSIIEILHYDIYGAAGEWIKQKAYSNV